MPDKIIEAIWSIVQANMQLLGGTTLHLLIVRKKSERNAEIKPVGVIGWFTLAGISLLTGVLFRLVGVAYYSFHGLDERSGVLEFLGMLGASVGFAGLVFIMTKIQSGWDLLFKAKLEAMTGEGSRVKDYSDGYSDTSYYERSEDEKPKSKGEDN